MDTGARNDVLDFYKKLPFNDNKDSKIAAELIKQNNNLEYFYPFPDDFYYVNNCLEVGCGAGWMSNSVAYYYGTDVTAIDFNPVAIEKAKETAKTLGVNVQFECADLFQFECSPKDIVFSVGVLHHTSDCLGGVRRCIELTREGGHVFIGLYHKYGRKPFLDYFEKLKKENSDENFLFEKYRELDGRHVDEHQAKSWFLDQVLHPYETQHTLKEIVEVFQEMNVKLVSTSINQYEEIPNIEDLYLLEQRMYDTGMDYLREGKYYPGFFYVLGEKK